MNISTSITDTSQGLAVASIMDITQNAYSDSTGYSSVTACAASYDADGNVTGYTYSTDITDADGSSYSWSDTYDADWTLTQSAYSDSTGYSSVTACAASYDADGNVTGYTYTTDITDADGSSYSWTDTYDADWNLTQSDHAAGLEDNSVAATETQTQSDDIIMGDDVDAFVFNAGAENTDNDTTDAYLKDDSGQYRLPADMEDQSSSDAFVFDCTVFTADSFSLPDNNFI